MSPHCDRCAELEETILQMRDAFGAVPQHRRVGGIQLPPMEAAMLGLLLKRDLVTSDQITIALWTSKGQEVPENSTVGHHLCDLRRKLRTLGISIKNLRCAGWFIEPVDRARLREHCIDLSTPTEGNHHETRHRA